MQLLIMYSNFTISYVLFFSHSYAHLTIVRILLMLIAHNFHHCIYKENIEILLGFQAMLSVYINYIKVTCASIQEIIFASCLVIVISP